MNNKKNILIVLGIFLLILVVGGVTYAFFSYSRVGETNTIVTGSLYLNFEQDNQVVLDTLFPEDSLMARSHNPEDNVITFNINGYTETVDKDIIYGIKLEDGDVLDGKTRIDSENLRFDLIEVNNGLNRQLISNARYEDYRNGYIYVDRVVGRTTELPSGDAMYFTMVGNEEKQVGRYITGVKFNPITDEMVEECIETVNRTYSGWMEGETPEAYCRGTGTWYGETLAEYAERNPRMFLQNYPMYGESIIKYYKIKETNGGTIDACTNDYPGDEEVQAAICNGTYSVIYSSSGVDIEYKVNSGHGWHGTSFNIGDGRWPSDFYADIIEEVPSSKVYAKEARLKTTITPEIMAPCLEFVGDNLDEGENAESFCNGTGTYWGMTLADYWETDPDLVSGILPDYIEYVKPEVTYTDSKEVNLTYKLRVWVDDDITISDTDESADYKTDEWQKLYASIKIRVDGDFLEKEQMEPISDRPILIN